MANARETLAAALGSFRKAGLPCDLFGGWAEELLGLRPPWQHADIDLVYRGDSLAAFDAIGGEFSPVPAKRFRHKRAFLFHGTLCEIILVREADAAPVTMFWGDVPFPWDRPLLHHEPLNICGEQAAIVSAANLEKYRRLHKQMQPDRWQDPASLEP